MASRELQDRFSDAKRRAELALLYKDFDVPRISLGTVRDYCDSADNLGPLSFRQQDLKDIQRCWILKAMLATFPPGSKLLEIGAGEPIVAGLLSRFGHDVTVVDPYDGCGNGPTELEMFRTQYPDIRFKVEYLSPSTDFGGERFDGIYSISVLEHVPMDAFDGVFEGIRKASHEKSVMLHAIDHVLRGAGAEYHMRMLTKVADCCAVPANELRDLLGTAEEDIETYFLSAEAHNRWRGNSPYSTFPMRRCISVQIAGKVN
jgi:hypothetical protein